MKPNPKRDRFRVAVLSVVKHDYVARGIASHPRFELVVVADDATCPEWIHERNSLFASEQGIPYVRNVEQALHDFDVDVAVVSSEAGTFHCSATASTSTLRACAPAMRHGIHVTGRALEHRAACPGGGVVVPGGEVREHGAGTGGQ